MLEANRMKFSVNLVMDIRPPVVAGRTPPGKVL